MYIYIYINTSVGLFVLISQSDCFLLTDCFHQFGFTL